MKIRKARKGDERDLMELYPQFWEIHNLIDPLIKPAKKLTRKSYLNGAKENIKKFKFGFLVAEIDGKVVGYIEFMIKKNENFFKVKRYGYLDATVTHKNYRKRGVAKALTKEAIKSLKKRGIKYVKANVYNSNKIAIGVWKKLGFKENSTMLLKKI
ncbi:MAG: GNAT family N-acetyltransferase [archaeon]